MNTNTTRDWLRRPRLAAQADPVTATTTADVCIIGAGIAGLNAAFVASRYLEPHQRIVLVDRQAEAGGMWNQTYDYVRLHQPHPMFTAGNIPWTIGRESSYLPTGREVSTHLRHCLDVIARDVQVETRWSTEYVAHTEVDARVTITLRDADGVEHTVVADKLIKAGGFEIEANDPLPLTSTSVVSASPHDLMSIDSQAPVWVIGSGKTAMDTVNLLLTTRPGREINMVAGSGTFFLNRDQLYPTGARRWFGGTRANAALATLSRVFDGTNDQEAKDWFLASTGISPLPDPEHNAFGLLSEAECEAVRTGLTSVVRDHLEDVVDDGDDICMRLRSGTMYPIAPGSVIVNCTGYFPLRDIEVEPYTSASGAVLSINGSAMVLGPFTTLNSYFLTHLMFLDALASTPLHHLDSHALNRKAKRVSSVVVAALIQHNLSLITDVVPLKAVRECHLDFDAWYPRPRVLAGQLRFLASHHRDREHHRRTLQTVAERFDLDIGPVATARRVDA